MLTLHFRDDPAHRAGAGPVPAATLCLIVVLLGILALPPAAARGQALTGGPDEKLPIQIEADSGIEWDQNAHLYIARGNAVAIRGPSEAHADTLIAHYREAKGGGNAGAKGGTGASGSADTGANTEIYRVEAEGHVTLKRNDQIVVGDKAIDDLDRSVAVVTGKNLKLTTLSDVVTARDSLEWYDQKQIAVARGDAVAIRNGRTVKGDVLTAYMVKTAAAPAKPGAPAGKSAAPKKPITPASAARGSAGAAPGEESKISRVDAQGHVFVSNGTSNGRGDFGVYNADTGVATLIGNVVIERGKDVIRGQRGVMDLNRNVSRILPGGAPGVAQTRVQGLFVRQNLQGNAATQATPAGASPAGASPAGPAGKPAASAKKP
jgi:lipopolysaccharide export system protein LptA